MNGDLGGLPPDARHDLDRAEQHWSGSWWHTTAGGQSKTPEEIDALEREVGRSEIVALQDEQGLDLTTGLDDEARADLERQVGRDALREEGRVMVAISRVSPDKYLGQIYEDREHELSGTHALDTGGAAVSFAGPWDVDPEWSDDQEEIDDMADAETIASAATLLGWTDLEPIDLDALIGPATSPDQYGYHEPDQLTDLSHLGDLSEDVDDLGDQL